MPGNFSLLLVVDLLTSTIAAIARILVGRGRRSALLTPALALLPAFLGPLTWPKHACGQEATVSNFTVLPAQLAITKSMFPRRVAGIAIRKSTSPGISRTIAR